MTPLESRTWIVDGFRRTVVGPRSEDAIEEELDDFPIQAYLTGFLAPQGAVLGAANDDDLPTSDDDGRSAESIPNLVNAMRPSAMGVTVTVSGDVRSLDVKIEASCYLPIEVMVPTQSTGKRKPAKRSLLPTTPPDQGSITNGQGAVPAVGAAVASVPAVSATAAALGPSPSLDSKTRWKRMQRSVSLRILLTGPADRIWPFTGTNTVLDTLELRVDRHLPSGGACPVTLTLINRTKIEKAGDLSESSPRFIHQPRLVISGGEGHASPFVEPPVVDPDWNDPDVAQHLLLHRNSRHFAIGHGVAAMWTPDQGDVRRAARIWTEFIPEHQVLGLRYEPDLPVAVKDILDLRNLAGGKEDAWIIATLRAFIETYGAWIDGQEGLIPKAMSELRDPTTSEHIERKAARVNISAARVAVERMRDGVRTLEDDPRAMRCFRLANEAMLEQALAGEQIRGQRSGGGTAGFAPRWRSFQLAFIVLSLNSFVCPDRLGTTDREILDLIWFPTGGGKTEAYLGVTAFCALWRRLSKQNPDAGAGTAVITRYTLRLLTTQQFERASRLMCALEVLRKRGKDLRGNPISLGNSRFSIGMWIGGGSSPNRFTDGRDDPGAFSILKKLKDDPNADIAGPDLRQLRTCPWCGTAMTHFQSWEIRDGAGTRITRKSELGGVGVHLVMRCSDRSRKCQFSQDEGLPVSVVDDQIYDQSPTLVIGTVDKFARIIWEPKTVKILGEAGRPGPDLVIQDEMHLISGPLGTVVAMFEAAIDTAIAASGHAPKIIGSTATIRRAEEQGRELFDRTVQQFPPPMLDIGDNWFACTDTVTPGRLYLGIMTPGVTGKNLFLRCAGSLLQLASELPAERRDPWWTLLGYFNSLRELAGANVLCQDDVPRYMERLATIRKSLGLGGSGTSRRVDVPVELTSRVSSSKLVMHLDVLQKQHPAPGAVDIALATNMISVGVDIDRLGLMLVRGQPKTTSEYIQATSRVGRRPKDGPGLVVTAYSWTRPRDRSHYERFVPYHAAFYREVEASSVTPWAPQSRKRYLEPAMIAAIRLMREDLRASPTDLANTTVKSLLASLAPMIDRCRHQDSGEAAAVATEMEALLTYWTRWATTNGNTAIYGNGYFRPNAGLPMLRTADEHDESKGIIAAPTSMRSVEPECTFKLRKLHKRI